MSYLKKYAAFLITAIFMLNGVITGYAYAQTTEDLLAKLEKEEKALAKLIAKTAEENISFENPLEALGEIESQILLDEKAPETVKNVNEIKESRYEVRREAIFQSFILAAKNKFNKKSSKVDVDLTVELLKTMPGESEGSGTYSEALLKEMDVLMDYIRAELANLKREAAVAAAEINHVRSAGNISENFNICQYYTERRKKKSLLEQAQGWMEKGKNAVSQVSEGAATVSEIKNSTQTMINEAQGVIPLKPEDLTGGMI